MLRLVCVLFVAVAAAGILKHSDLDLQWNEFKAIHNKRYSNRYEEEYRKNLFRTNVMFIEDHNQKAENGAYRYTLGINRFADLSLREFAEQMNGLMNDGISNDMNTNIFTATGIPEDLPPTVDWRPKGYVTGIKDQKQCGSCWAFSATGSLEGQHFKKTGNLVSLSEQNLMDCSRKQGNMGCEGGLPDLAFDYVVHANNGIDTEASYPYEARDDVCRFRRSTVGANCIGYVDVQSGSETALQAASAVIGPISVGIDANHQQFMMYKSGVYDNPQCSSTALDHGVLVVGYGNYQGKDYWLVKNSWGLKWGMEGYVMMSRNKNNQCGIATAASYPVM